MSFMHQRHPKCTIPQLCDKFCVQKQKIQAYQQDTHGESVQQSGRTDRERKIEESETEKKKNCDRELIGAEPWSETVDSVEKQCGYCETAVSAFSALTGQSQTRMHCL